MTDILKGRCPRCRKGKIFKHPPYNYFSFHKMNEECPKCGQTFHPEPGFYFGAMYVSYSFSVAWVLAVCFALLILDAFTLINAASIILGGIILIFPFIFQYSRILFLYGFGGIRKKKE